MKACPHCGAVLPDEASFCPSCAQAVTIRKAARPRRRLPVRLLFGLLAIAAAVLLAAAVQRLRPQTYDNGTAEVLYTLNGETYQLCVAWADSPMLPTETRHTTMALEFKSRYPSLLFVNHFADGSNAADEFLPHVDSVTAELLSDYPDDILTLSCTAPRQLVDYVPEAASITYVDSCIWREGAYDAQLVFTIHMENGDTLRVRQRQIFQSVKTYTYTAEDTPMGTAEELQALLDEISLTVEEDADVDIYLPSVTYPQSVTLNRRAVNLHGSVDEAGRRTTFTAPIHLVYPNGAISYFENIDFTGDGGGTGISVDSLSRLQLDKCRLSGWDTAVMCHETSWVNADQCTFSGNGVGLYINNNRPNMSDSRYGGNTFQNNGTAVVLERVGVDTPMKFDGSLFSGNGTDIDNRCGQALELEKAVFQ